MECNITIRVSLDGDSWVSAGQECNLQESEFVGVGDSCREAIDDYVSQYLISCGLD